jgi:hypothetical protein
MAGEIPPLNIHVNVDTSGVTAGVQQTTDKLKGLTSTVEGSTGKFGGLKTVMLGTFAAGAIQKGIQEMTGFLKESVKAAEEAQTSTVALATAMNNAKINTEANRQVVEKSTEAMANLGFTGNSTREALTKMVTATGDMTQAQKLMGVAADYARLKHMDLASAATVLTRGTTGAARAFREYGITLDTTIPKNQAITKAFAQLNEKIGGQAAAYAQTYAGKMAILGAKSEELKEKVGSLLLPVLTKLSTWFLSSLDWLSKHKVAMEAIATLVVTVVTVAVANLTKKLYEQAAAWIAANIEIIAIVAALGLVAAGFAYVWNHSETFRKVVTSGIKIVIEAIGYLIGAIGKIVEAMSHLPVVGKHFKGLADGINGAAQSVGDFAQKLDGLSSKKIDIKFPSIADMLAKAGGKAGEDPNIAAAGTVATTAAQKAAAAAQKVADANAKKLQAQYDKMKTLETDYAKALQDRQDKMDTAKSDWQQKQLDAQTKFDQAKADIEQAYQDKVDAATAAHDQAVEAIEQNHADAITAIKQAAADKATQIEQAAAQKRAGIIQQSIDAMTGAWANATKLDLGSIFKTDGTAGGLVKGMKEQLAAILKLQKDAGDLAAQGYSESFINQVISQGPAVGDQMAQAVLNATPETAQQIKDLYAQINTVSDSGLTALATQMSDGTHFATAAMAREYAQVGIELQKSLAENQAQLATDLALEDKKYTDALNKAQEAFDKAQKAAADSRDLALKKAQDTLTNALKTAAEAYDSQIAAIAKSMDDKLSALQAKISATAAAIASLGGMSVSSDATGIDPNSVYGKKSILNPPQTPVSTTPTKSPTLTQIFNSSAPPSPAAVGQAAVSILKFGQVVML